MNENEKDLEVIEEKDETKSIEYSKRMGRSMMMRLLCGLYLGYLVYSMVTEQLKNPSAGWELYLSWGAIVLFSAATIWILVSYAKYSIKNFKESVAAMDEAEKDE